jgi:signal transduction histidine kinase
VRVHGGIGKGWIVDQVAQKLAPWGAALVDAGGDMRATAPPDGAPVALSPRARQAGQPLVADLPDELSPVLTPAADLETIVGNLLDNALKYTPAGGVVRLDAAHGDGLLRLRVADNGPGIPAEELEQIFQRFYRVDQARGRQAYQVGAHAGSGAGLGLALVRSLVESYGGSVQAASVPGQGPSFTVLLPVVGAPPRDVV